MKYLRRFWAIYLAVIMVFAAVVHGTDRAVSVIAENLPVERKTVIVVDAGHGGVDGGATSCTGVLESQLNLEIALRLNDLLHLLGFETVMVRTTDISVYTEGESIAAKKVSDLKNRVKLVNDLENSILVSIHQNIFPDSRYSGAQVFYNDTNTRHLAQALQNAFKTLDPGSTRTCKKAQGVYLMQHIQRPGLLVECGFLSNPQEEAKLRSPEYQILLCCAIGSVLSKSNT